MTQISARALRENLAETLESAARGDDVIVTRNGRELAAVISMDAYRALVAMEDEALGRLASQRLAELDPSIPLATLDEVLAETAARTS
jgi:prevent-host-death family protein